MNEIEFYENKSKEQRALKKKESSRRHAITLILGCVVGGAIGACMGHIMGALI